MRKEIGVDVDAKYFKVIDLGTGQEIPNCIMADEATGHYVQNVTDINGELVRDEHSLRRRPLRKHSCGRIKLVDTREIGQ
jgi:hypothetical protein